MFGRFLCSVFILNPGEKTKNKSSCLHVFQKTGISLLLLLLLLFHTHLLTCAPVTHIDLLLQNISLSDKHQSAPVRVRSNHSHPKAPCAARASCNIRGREPRRTSHLRGKHRLRRPPSKKKKKLSAALKLQIPIRKSIRSHC